MLAQVGIEEFIRILDGELTAGHFIDNSVTRAALYLRGNRDQLERI